MKKLLAVVASVLCAGGLFCSVQARTVEIDSVEKNGDGLETAFNLVMGEGTETSDTLYMVYGETDGGDSVDGWSMAMRVGDIPAETTALKVPAPQHWGEKFFYVRFVFRDGSDGLPFDNAVEWVAKGNKCDTFYLPNNNSKLILDIHTFVGKNDNKSEYWAGVWDVNWASMSFAICTDGNAQYVAFDKALSGINKIDIGRYTLELSKDGYFINGEKKANCSATTFQNKYALYLFCQDRIGSASSATSGDARFYGVQISESSELVRDYVPVVKDGRAYFYDRVNGKPDHGPLYEMSNAKATYGDIVDIRSAAGLAITPSEDGWSDSYVRAEISVAPDPYEVSYDAQPHAARIVLGYPPDATLEWSTDGGATYVADAPAWTDAGEHACLCRVSKQGFGEKIVETTVSVTAIPFADCVSEPIPAQDYEPGDPPPEPQPVLTYNGYTLVVGTDVECAYSGNTSWGTATVTVTPKTENVTGEAREFTFIVKPRVPIEGDVVYVRPGGTGHGTSWADALGSPVIGVTLALATRAGMSVRLAAGTYEMPSGIEILRATGLTLSGGWDPSTDSQVGMSVLSAASALRTALVTVREAGGVVIENLTLCDALNYSAEGDACGGALDVDCATNLVLSGCAILNSCAYTAAFRAHALGGGACFRRSSGVAISNSVFRNNRVIAADAIASDRPSLGGGGAAFLTTSGEVVGSVFAGNRVTGKANDAGGTFGAWGGGVMLELYSRSDANALLNMVFTNCLIAGNATYIASSLDATYRGLPAFDSATEKIGDNTTGPGCGAGVWSYRGTFNGCSIVDNPGEAINTPEVIGGGCSTAFNDCIVRGNLTAVGNCLWAFAKFKRCNIEYYDCCGIASQAKDASDVDIPTGFGPDWSATADEMATCGYHPTVSAFAVPRTVNVADVAGLVAALAELGDNDTLVIAEGTYALTAPVRLAGRTRVVLAGAGKGRTVLDFGGVSRGLEIDGCADVEVRDLTVTNAFVSGAVAQGAGVFALCSGNVRFVRAEVTGCVAETGAEATGTTRGGGFLLSAATVDFAESDITGCRVRSAATTATVGPAAIEALGATRVIADRLRITGNAIDSATAKGLPAAVAVRLLHYPCLNINKDDVIGHWPGLSKFRQTLIADNTASAYGNLPAFYGSQWSLESTTIAGNVWTRGTTSCGWGIDTPIDGNHFMTNSVIGGHVIDFRNRQYKGRPHYAHSCIQKLTHAGDDGGISELAYFEANTSEMLIDVDPLFRSRGGDPWQLQKGSPCVDQALWADWMTKDATDIVGKRRVYGAGPDLGAYECIPPGLLLMVR